MNLQTFKAATMAEALSQVKSSIGHDALILHTRTYQKRYWLGLRRKDIVEITAGKGSQLRPKARTQPQKAVQAAAGKAAPQVAAAAPAMSRTQALLQTPAAGSAAILGLSQEMASLKTMVKELVSTTRQQSAPQVPEELFEYYLQLIEGQVAEELAGEIIKTLQRQIRPEYLSRPDYIREKLAEQLEKLMPSTGPLVRTKMGGPQIVALIGPTGVGKTTTIAKLAATLKINQKQRVGLITIDTYRIAAIEQLKKYADILDAPLKVVSNTDDMRAAIGSMQDCDFILIDTAGRSPKDTLKLNELKTFLAAANPDEVHLVLSTTASQACVELAIERFSNVRVDKIIFTKLDEAAHVGVVLNVIKKVNKSLSYITTGQDVPNDIEVGRGRRLAQLILRKSDDPQSEIRNSKSEMVGVSR
ncbi:MAG TPA: flagellar biosynthesis protein FlhF [Tepidisphaeraceae bacterium]|jgi:flagellar biosynthesis protein FlhF|nr:flagellar biosynthesis protein FlhF [Tepidisphaeraceae bacterium]